MLYLATLFVTLGLSIVVFDFTCFARGFLSLALRLLTRVDVASCHLHTGKMASASEARVHGRAHARHEVVQAISILWLFLLVPPSVRLIRLALLEAARTISASELELELAARRAIAKLSPSSSLPQAAQLDSRSSSDIIHWSEPIRRSQFTCFHVHVEKVVFVHSNLSAALFPCNDMSPTLDSSFVRASSFSSSSNRQQPDAASALVRLPHGTSKGVGADMAVSMEALFLWHRAALFADFDSTVTAY
ncbi:hypothetical protein KC345_g123 [Hortaea werneckii]|nr:hypothetical protein KC345_g123 [Hortaea werneckii]